MTVRIRVAPIADRGSIVDREHLNQRAPHSLAAVNEKLDVCVAPDSLGFMGSERENWAVNAHSLEEFRVWRDVPFILHKVIGDMMRVFGTIKEAI